MTVDWGGEKTIRELRKLTLQDGTGYICVCFWGDRAVNLCSEYKVKVGDNVKVTNVTSNNSKYIRGAVQLYSTSLTQVNQVI